MEKKVLYPFLLALAASMGFALSACSGSDDENTGDDGKGIGTNDGGTSGDASGVETDSGTNEDAGPTDNDDAGPVFGRTCTQQGEPGDCPAGYICHNYPNKGVRCTRACTAATVETDCPETKKCGRNGRCSMP